MISIILTVHNKENLIGNVYSSILKNKSNLSKEIIVVLDGCTDNSERIINTISVPDAIVYTDDFHEVRANNAGLLTAGERYCLLIQDDMVIHEPEFDRRLLRPFLYFRDVFAVTGRQTTNDRLENDHIVFTDLTSLDRNLFQIRDVAIRGPLLLRNDYVQKLGYLNEEFAPVTFDDHDLCINAKKHFNLVSGSYVIDVESRPEWGTTRQKNQSLWQSYYNKNEQLLIKYHKEFLLSDKIIDDRILC